MPRSCFPRPFSLVQTPYTKSLDGISASGIFGPCIFSIWMSCCLEFLHTTTISSTSAFLTSSVTVWMYKTGPNCNKISCHWRIPKISAANLPTSQDLTSPGQYKKPPPPEARISLFYLGLLPFQLISFWRETAGHEKASCRKWLRHNLTAQQHKTMPLKWKIHTTLYMITHLQFELKISQWFAERGGCRDQEGEGYPLIYQLCVFRKLQQIFLSDSL